MSKRDGEGAGPRTSAFLAAVGERVRARRKARGWTVAGLAEASGLSRRMLTQIELGQANPSLATIDRVAHALGTGFAQLALDPAGTVSEEAAREQSAVQASPAGAAPAGVVAWEGPLGSCARILGAAHGNGAELWHWRLAPGVRYTAEPDRPGAQEIHHVLAGRLRIEADSGVAEVAAGSTAVIDSDQHYAYANPGGEPAVFLRVVAGA